MTQDKEPRVALISGQTHQALLNAQPEPAATGRELGRWPRPLAPEAYHGIAGEVVKAIELHTEADPAALLITFLCYVGNSIGRGPHAVAEADRHGTNVSSIIVGETAKGRKGSSAGHIRELFRRVDLAWESSRIMGGMSSGEGLIWHVRDPIEKHGEVEDMGVTDKRLLVYEPEFASVLKVMARDTNTLSTQVRQAWDSGYLRIMTKNSPAVATDTHISILGHITKDELLRYMTATEMGNGFANRFLWFCTKRARILPEGGGTPDYESLIPKLQAALEKAKKTGQLARDDNAREAWADIYPELSEGKPGLYGAVTARAEAQVLRLSVLYAALDGSTAILLPHLMAALAVWEYADQSVRYIFGDAIGDPAADRILQALRVAGEMTRTQIRGLFTGHSSASRISGALRLLAVSGKASSETRQTDGRPTEVWMPLEG